MSKTHYNAFISYNHNPRDSRIAENIQRKLENFVMPKRTGADATATGGDMTGSKTEISKVNEVSAIPIGTGSTEIAADIKTESSINGLENNTGTQSATLTGTHIEFGAKDEPRPQIIERVFLDKGELEAAGDLNKVILDALDNSDKLIVICSPESKASIWVQREIEFFLQKHSVNDILTVITEGEPFDVLPDQILHEEVTDESGRTVIKQREPLSADYRLPMRKANAQELPRLIAAILGCRYDDLVQRQRAYRMKRQTIAATIAAVLLLSSTAYLIWSNHQINTNFERSLREQALNLSMQSQQALSRGDRVNAIRYALDALPSEDNRKQPVTSEALLALSNAINLYKTPYSRTFEAVRQYGKDCWAGMDAAVINDTVYLATIENRAGFHMWNAVTGEELMADHLAKAFDDLAFPIGVLFTDSGKLVLAEQSELLIIDPVNEKELNRLSLEYIDGVGEDGKGIISLFSTPFAKGDDVWTLIDGLPSGYEYAVRINIDSGKIKTACQFEASPLKFVVSDDGKYLAYYYLNESEQDSGFEYRIVDVETGKTVISGNRQFISDIMFDTEGRFIVCGNDRKVNAESIMSMNDRIQYGTRQITNYKTEKKIRISCIDTESGDEVWTSETLVKCSGKPWLAMAEGPLKGDILCASGTVVLDLNKNGDLKNKIEYNSPVVNVIPNNGNNVLSAILYDGELADFNPENGGIYAEYNCFKENISDLRCLKCGDKWHIFTLSSDTSDNTYSPVLTQYMLAAGDPKWQELSTDDLKLSDREILSLTAAAPYGDCFLEVLEKKSRTDKGTKRVSHIVVRKSDSDQVIHTSDAETGSAAYDSEGNEIIDTNFVYCGTDQKTDTAYWLDMEGKNAPRLLSVDLKKGKQTITDVIINGINNPEAIVEVVPEGEGSEGNEGKTEFDVDNDPLADCELIKAEGSDSAAVSCVKDGKIHFIMRNNDPDSGLHDDMVTLDPSTGQADIDHTLDYGSYFGANSDFSLIAFQAARDNHVSCYDCEKGKTLWDTKELPYSVAGIDVSDDGFVAVAGAADNGALDVHLLDARTGKEISTVTFENGDSILAFQMKLNNISDKEYLLSFGDDAVVFDKETGQILSKITDAFVAYNPETQMFMLGNPDHSEKGLAPYRTIDEMIAEGQEIIK